MPVFLPGKSHGQMSLVGYSPQGQKESDTTEGTEHSCMHSGSPGYFNTNSLSGCSIIFIIVELVTFSVLPKAFLH